MPARMKAEGGLDYIRIKLGTEPVCDGCKACKNQKRRRRNAERHSLTPNYPVWFLITPELLHNVTRNCILPL